MVVHPIPDLHHRRLGPRDHTPLDEEPPDRHVGLSVLPVVANPDHAAIPQPNSARALDLQKKRVDRIIDPEEFQPTPGERAILDLGPGIARGSAELGRTPVDRRLITPSTLLRPVQLDLVVSREQPLPRAVIGDRKRNEGGLEEPARGSVVLRRQHRSGLAQLSPCADPSVIRNVRPCVERRRVRQRQKPGAGFEK